MFESRSKKDISFDIDSRNSPAAFVTPLSARMLLNLRWLALLGQLTVLAVAYFALQLELAYGLLLGIAGALACSNCVLYFLVRSRPQVSKQLVGCVLLFDIFLLTVALALTGGPANPFSILYLVHIALAAVLLNERWTWLMSSLTILMFGLLFRVHQEVAGLEMHHHGSGFSAHLQGMWFAFALTALLLAFFVCRILKAIQMRDEELTLARLSMARNERFTSLTTLAAGAAHELATPLATIGVVAEELERELRQLTLPAELLEDVRILRSEVTRSAKILDEMRGQADMAGAEEWSSVDYERFVGELSKRIGEGASGRVSFFGAAGAKVVAPHHGLQRTITALIKNALDAGESNSPVATYIETGADFLTVKVQDRGHGMSADVLEKACEPFYTTKPTGRGMGLGLFLAKTFCDKHGGTIGFESKPGIGTTVTITLPSMVAEDVRIKAA